MIYPAFEDIVRLNHRHIETTGGEWIGRDNVMNPGGLKWVLDAIRYPLFGVECYPTLADKASLLAWIIIADHVFFDGCKRTGMSAMEVFLISNGYQLPVAGDEIRDVGIRIAKHVEENYTREELARWVRSRMRFIPVL